MAMVFLLLGFHGVSGEQGNGGLGIREIPNGPVTEGLGEKLVIADCGEPEVFGPVFQTTVG
jgi:hypothetical protein